MSGTDPLATLTGNLALYTDVISSTVDQISRTQDPNATQTKTEIVSGKGGQLNAHVETLRPDAVQQDAITKGLGDLTYWDVLETAYDQIDHLFGAPGENGIFGSALSDFQRAARYFSENPGEEVRQREFIANAETLSTRIGDFQKSVERLRKNADASISDAVNDIVGALEALETSSKVPETVKGTAAEADYETSRRNAMEIIAKYMPTQTTLVDSTEFALRSGGIEVFSSGVASKIEFDKKSDMAPTDRYPKDLSGIKVTDVVGNVTDITGHLKTGGLAALFKLRDDVLPGVLENTRQLADVVRHEVNTALNKGASFEGRNQLASLGSYAGGDTVRASGTIHVAVMDADQKVVRINAVNLANENITAVLGKLNTALGADGTAALGADGKLTITATNAANSIAIHEGDSKVVERAISVTVQDATGAQHTIAFDTVTQNVAAMNAAIAADANVAGNVVVKDVNGSFEVEGMNGAFVQVNGGSLDTSDMVYERGFSHFFGFNDLFVDSSLNVARYFAQNPGSIPFGALDTTQAAGGVALSSHGYAVSATEARPADLMRDVFSKTVHFSKTSGQLGRKESTLFDRVHDMIEAPSSAYNIVKNRKADAEVAAKTAMQTAKLKLNETEWYMYFMKLNATFGEQLRMTHQIQRNNGQVVTLLAAAA